MGPTILTTQRLALRAWEPDDAPRVVALFDDPDVARFVNRGKPIRLTDAEEFVTRQMRTQAERGWCRWALELHTAPGELAGFCGPGCTFAPDLELGWTLRRDLWCRGLATEAASAALAFLFGVVGFAEVVSAIDPRNEASERVASRIGMSPDGSFEHDGLVLTRWAMASPVPTPPPDPRYVRSCTGEVSGPSFAPPDESLPATD